MAGVGPLVNGLPNVQSILPPGAGLNQPPPAHVALAVPPLPTQTEQGRVLADRHATLTGIANLPDNRPEKAAMYKTQAALCASTYDAPSYITDMDSYMRSFVPNDALLLLKLLYVPVLLALSVLFMVWCVAACRDQDTAINYYAAAELAALDASRWANQSLANGMPGAELQVADALVQLNVVRAGASMAHGARHMNLANTVLYGSKDVGRVIGAGP